MKMARKHLARASWDCHHCLVVSVTCLKVANWSVFGSVYRWVPAASDRVVSRHEEDKDPRDGRHLHTTEDEMT